MLKFKYIALSGSVLLIVIDQIIKFFAVENLSKIIDGIPIINKVLHLTYVENRGAAFGIFEGKTAFLSFLTIIMLGIAIGLIFYKKIQSKFLIISLSLIVAGGIGNLIDRIFRGFVVDYIDVRIINFAIFNLADCFVVTGGVLVVFYVLFIDVKKPKKNVKGE